MKLLKIAWFFAIATSIVFASCKKDHEDSLPPATQTGAGTFGCKINGKVFIPKGSSGTGTPNPHIQYDLDLNGQPYLAIEAKHFIGANNADGTIIVSFLNLNQLGMYSIPNDFRYSIGWQETIGNCGVSISDPTVKAWGGGQVTRLDIPNRIISGTFDFKALKSGCDTIRITEGRFDIKF